MKSQEFLRSVLSIVVSVAFLGCAQTGVNTGGGSFINVGNVQTGPATVTIPLSISAALGDKVSEEMAKAAQGAIGSYLGGLNPAKAVTPKDIKTAAEKGTQAASETYSKETSKVLDPKLKSEINQSFKDSLTAGAKKK